jgi:hypothetical protein
MSHDTFLLHQVLLSAAEQALNKDLVLEAAHENAQRHRQLSSRYIELLNTKI